MITNIDNTKSWTPLISENTKNLKAEENDTSKWGSDWKKFLLTKILDHFEILVNNDVGDSLW